MLLPIKRRRLSIYASADADPYLSSLVAIARRDCFALLGALHIFDPKPSDKICDELRGGVEFIVQHSPNLSPSLLGVSIPA